MRGDMRHLTRLACYETTTTGGSGRDPCISMETADNARGDSRPEFIRCSIRDCDEGMVLILPPLKQQRGAGPVSGLRTPAMTRTPSPITLQRARTSPWLTINRATGYFLSRSAVDDSHISREADTGGHN